MPTKNGWVQGYNNQFAVSADQIILATQVSTNPADILSYHTMVAATEQASSHSAPVTNSAPCSSTPATSATTPSPPPAPTS